MTDATFERVSRSDKRIYGPRKLLLCGFDADTQAKFNSLLEMLGLSALPRVWAAQAQGEVELGQLMSLEDGSGKGQSSESWKLKDLLEALAKERDAMRQKRSRKK